MVGIGVNMVRLVLAGTVGGVQTWSTSWWVSMGSPVPDPSQDDLDAFVANCADAIQPSLEAVVGNTMSNSTKVDTLTGYTYDPNTVKSHMVSTAAPLNLVGVGTGALPYFTSIVASLRTGVPGRSGRGRNYIPLTIGGVVQGNGQIGLSTAQNIASGWAGCLDAINGITDSQVAPNGLSVGVASFTKGVIRPVTTVVVDTIPDTQHRRTDQLVAVGIARSNV